MIARCLLVTSVDAIEAGECELPAPGPGEVLIETSYSGISPGTELRALAGKQDGMPQYPFIPGYSLSGVVVETGPGCALPIGARVHTGGTRHASVNRLWGGHISHAVRAEREVYRIPDNVDLRDAALTRLLAIAYHGVRLSHPAAHETVAVVGLGPIGQLSARLHGVSGAQVVAADLSPERVDRARAAGVEAFVLEGDLVEGFQRYFPTGADVVADSTGAKAVLPQAIELAKIPAWGDGTLAPSRFLIQGSYPGDIMLPYNVAFLREAQILFPRDCQPGDVEAVLDLLHRERLKVADLRETVRRPEEAPETYVELKSAKSGMLTAIFDWKA